MSDVPRSARHPPPGVSADESVVLFDGVCNLCNAAVTFLLQRDPAGRLRFASLQSATGQAILRWAGLPTDDFDTMAFLERGRLYLRSTAALRVARHLKWPWNWLTLIQAVPAGLRDWVYGHVTRNRYALFGKRDECLLPTPELSRRFL